MLQEKHFSTKTEPSKTAVPPNSRILFKKFTIAIDSTKEAVCWIIWFPSMENTVYDTVCFLQTPESSSIIVSIEICVCGRISEGGWNDFSSLLFFPEYALTKVSSKAMMKLTKKSQKKARWHSWADFRFDPGLPKKPNKRSSIFTRMTKVLLVKK